MTRSPKRVVSKMDLQLKVVLMSRRYFSSRVTSRSLSAPAQSFRWASHAV